MLLEVCVDSFDSAKTAVDNGADRLELCGPLGIGGGTSPSFALVKQIQAAFPSTPLMIMVRPRPGDFVYSPSEISLMMDEIDLLQSLQPSIMGVVLGCLLLDGRVDIDSSRLLVERAHPLQVTFHRAFDMTFYPGSYATSTLEALRTDALGALLDLRSIPGITRILTSGLHPSFSSSFNQLFSPLQTLQAHTSPPLTPPHDKPILLLPGSGLNTASLRAPPPRDDALNSQSHHAASTEPTLLDELRTAGVTEIHASCSSFVEGPVLSEARREGMGMGGWKKWEVDGRVVREMRALLDGEDGRS